MAHHAVVPGTAPARHLPSGIVAFLAVLLGVLGVTQVQPDVYSSSAVVSFEPRGNRPLTGATVTLLVPRYVAFATSDFVISSESERLSLPPEQVRDSLQASVAPETANLTITSSGSDPNLVHATAETFAGAVVDEARADTLLRATLVSPAQVPATPSGPDRTRLLLGGLLAAVLAGVAAAYGVGAWRSRRAGGPGS